MWGNAVGWIIAAVLFLLIGLSTYLVAQMNAVSGATAWGRQPAHLAPLELGIPPASVVKLDAPGDAGVLYQAAIADVRANRRGYERFNESGRLPEVAALPAIGSVLKARGMSQGQILALNVNANVGYFPDAVSPELADLLILGEAVGRTAALYQSEKKYEPAKQHYEALFTLGNMLFNERVSFMEARNGLGMMGTAVAGLKQIAVVQKQDQRVDELNAFDVARLDLLQAPLDEMWGVINSVSEAKIAQHAGDIFYFTTTEQKEPMWRTEATLKLGRFRFNVGGAQGRKADQLAADDRLAELAKDPNPAVAAAARAALALTLEQYRVLIK